MAAKKAAREYLEELMAQVIDPEAGHYLLDSLNIPEERREGITYDEALWTRLLHKALGGDMKAITEVLDRRYGKSPQHIVQENHNMNYVGWLESLDNDQNNQIEPQVIEIGSKDVVRGLSKELTLEDLGLI